MLTYCVCCKGPNKRYRRKTRNKINSEQEIVFKRLLESGSGSHNTKRASKQGNREYTELGSDNRGIKLNVYVVSLGNWHHCAASVSVEGRDNGDAPSRRRIRDLIYTRRERNILAVSLRTSTPLPHKTGLLKLDLSIKPLLFEECYRGISVNRTFSEEAESSKNTKCKCWKMKSANLSVPELAFLCKYMQCTLQQ